MLPQNLASFAPRVNVRVGGPLPTVSAVQVNPGMPTALPITSTARPVATVVSVPVAPTPVSSVPVNSVPVNAPVARPVPVQVAVGMPTASPAPTPAAVAVPPAGVPVSPTLQPTTVAVNNYQPPTATALSTPAPITGQVSIASMLSSLFTNLVNFVQRLFSSLFA